MEPWLLRSQEEYFLLTEDTIRPVERSTDSYPCVLSPSFNFRSYLAIPSDTNREPREIRLDLFKNSLPKSIEELKYQFVDLRIGEEGEKIVLALAITDERYRAVVSDERDFGDLYFFEALIAQRGEPEPRLNRIHFPDGLFYGLHRESLVWSSFISTPSGRQKNITERYVRDNFDEPLGEMTIESFTGESVSRKDWTETVNEILPERFAPSRSVTSDGDQNLLGELRTSFVFFLVLLIISSSIWIYTSNRRQTNLSEWMSNQYREITGERTNNPVNNLTNRVNELNSLGQNKDRLYPLVTVLDRHLSKFPLRVLRLKLTAGKTTLVALAESLEDVETLRDRLRRSERIRAVSIASSNSMAYQEFNYRVKLSVQWA